MVYNFFSDYSFSARTGLIYSSLLTLRLIHLLRKNRELDVYKSQNGNHVELDKIDFVKIYTAVNQNVGWMGEISTEVMTVEDLHFEN